MISRSHPLQSAARPPGSARIVRGYRAQVFAFAFRPRRTLFRHGNSARSRLIGKPRADHTLQQNLCALLVVYPGLDAIVVAKIEFSKVTMKVMVRAMLIHTTHAALEYGKV